MLNITVKGQKIYLVQPVIAADTVDYLEAEFLFKGKSGVWDHLTKFAHFSNGETHYHIMLENDRISRKDHLNLTAGVWDVYVHGNSADGMRVTTTITKLTVEETGTAGGSPLPEMPLPVAEKIAIVAKNAKDTADSVRRDANAGKFKGEDGKPGADGGYYKPGIDGDNFTFTVSKSDMPPVEPVPIPGGGYAKKEYVDTAVKDVRKDIPTKTSQLRNDSGYLTEHQSLTDYAKKTEVPTKVSQLTNDAGFVTDNKTIQVLPPVTSIEDARKRGLDNFDNLPPNAFVPYSAGIYGLQPEPVPDSMIEGGVGVLTFAFGGANGSQRIGQFHMPVGDNENAQLYWRTTNEAGGFYGWNELAIPEWKRKAWDAKLSQSDLQGGIDKALAQARESGAFDGRDGNDGKTPALSIGKVDTLAPESPATAEITGPVENLKLNLGIPQGKQGLPGEGGSGSGGGTSNVKYYEKEITQVEPVSSVVIPFPGVRLKDVFEIQVTIDNPKPGLQISIADKYCGGIAGGQYTTWVCRIAKNKDNLWGYSAAYAIPGTANGASYGEFNLAIADKPLDVGLWGNVENNTITARVLEAKNAN